MKIVDTKVIKYGDGKVQVWLGPGEDESKFENMTVVEIRPVLEAEPGMILYKGNQKIGPSIWLKDGDSQDNYREVEMPIDIF